MADIICPSCNGRYHETTDRYSGKLPPNGSMFRLKQQYRENGWEGFPEHDGTIGENLICPDCGNQYPEGPTGKVRVESENSKRGPGRPKK